MNKGSKSKIAFTLFIFIAFTLLGLGYVSVKLKCEELTKEKVLAEEKLGAFKNTRISLIASQQYLTSDERIMDIAENELGMIKNTDTQMSLTVSKDKIDEINKILKEKYE